MPMMPEPTDATAKEFDAMSEPLCLFIGPDEDVTIREATEADVDGAAALEADCFDATLSLSRLQLARLARRASAVFLVAEQGGTIVGEGIALLRTPKSKGARRAPPTGRVYSLAVAGACRGRHVGRRLLRAMLAELVARGVRRVELEVEPTNAAAVQLYEDHGFCWAAYLPDYYGPGRTGARMVCDVAQPLRAVA